MPPVRPDAPPLLFRGWLVVIGAFLVMLVGYGAAYSYAAYADVLAASFGADQAAFSLVYALCGFTSFVVSGLSGPLADRVGPRPLAAAGVGMVALGLLTAAAARSFAEIMLCYGLLIGLGIGFSLVPAVAAVQRWFTVWRGLASGLAATGIGVGTALIPPATEALRAFGDWRTAFVIAAAVLAAIGICGALMLADEPEHYGLRPDGASGPMARPVVESDAAGDELAVVLRRQGFWLHYFGTMLVQVPVSLPFAHLVRSAETAGVMRSDALYLLSLIGIGSVAGRFALGALADELGRRSIFLACCVAVVVLTELWAIADSHTLFAVFAVGFGAAYGGFVALLPAVTTDRFGRRSAGGVLGVLYTGRGVALLLAAPLLAVLVDENGSYALPLGLMTLVGAAGVVLLGLRGRAV